MGRRSALYLETMPNRDKEHYTQVAAPGEVRNIVAASASQEF